MTLLVFLVLVLMTLLIMGIDSFLGAVSALIPSVLQQARKLSMAASGIPLLHGGESVLADVE